MARTPGAIKKVRPCKFNEQERVSVDGSTFPRAVDCDGGNCAICGWNPEVAEARKKDIRAAMHPPIKTWVIGRGVFTIKNQ